MSLAQHSRDFFRHQIVVTTRRANEAHDLRFIPWPAHNDNQLPPAELTATAGSCPAGTIKHTPAQVPAGFLQNVLSTSKLSERNTE